LQIVEELIPDIIWSLCSDAGQIIPLWRLFTLPCDLAPNPLSLVSMLTVIIFHILTDTLVVIHWTF